MKIMFRSIVAPLMLLTAMATSSSAQNPTWQLRSLPGPAPVSIA